MFRAASRLQVLLLPSVLACADGREFVALLDEGAQTSVLARRPTPGGSWEIQVAGPLENLKLEIEPGQEVRLHLYDETREALGLVPGVDARCQVLHPRASFLLTERAGVWSFLEDPVDAELGTALVGNAYRCDRCAPLTATAIIGPRVERFRGAAWLDEERVLLAGNSGFAIATRTAVEPIPDCPGLTDRPWSLAGAGPGRFWVGGGARELARIRLSSDGQTCEVETSTQAPPWQGPDRGGYLYFAAIAPDPEDPARHNLVAVSATGEVFRWTNTGLERLAQMQDHPEADVHSFGSIIRPETETFLTAHGWTKVYAFGSGGAVRVEDVEIPPESLATRPRDRVTALAIDKVHDRFLLGTAYGDIWSRAPGGQRWTRLAQSPLGEIVGSIWTTTRRHVVMHEAGDIGFVHFEEGTCPELGRIPQATRSGPMRVTLERGGTFFIGDVAGATDRETVVAWFSEPS